MTTIPPKAATQPAKGQPNRAADEGSERTPRAHTLVVSDLHLTEAEPDHPSRPLWKRYKRGEFFIDDNFAAWLAKMRTEIERSDSTCHDAELVLAGDIFDFDAVMALPASPPFPVRLLERLRGLDPEESKSRFKIKVILADHPRWCAALREFVCAGGKLVFVIGNHDLELHWPAVQAEVIAALDLPETLQASVRFTEWFYIAGDTLVEHGNQYDAYCVASDPVCPYIDKAGTHHLRLPFGNLAARFMVNGMGLFNPHVESSFLMSFREYVVFFFRYMLRVQPMLAWAWLWGAMVTLVRLISEGLRPAVRFPTEFASRLDGIAERANASASVVLALRQLHVHSAAYSPLKIMRELWLDRALLVLGLLYLSLQLVLLVNAFVPVNLMWMLVPLTLLMPAIVFYSRSIQTDVYDAQLVAFQRIPVAAEIAGVARVIHGHTHKALHITIQDIEHLNPGTWSPAFTDPECTEEAGRKCFVWLQPSATSGSRSAALYAWSEGDLQLLSGEPSTVDVDARLRRLSGPPPPP